MRLLFLSFLFLFSSFRAQVIFSPNTYYLIPPTNGCNGIWAIEDTLHCPVYALNPCFQFDHISGDTLFLKLCTIPCSFTAVDLNGNFCVNAICSYSTGVSSVPYNEDFSVYYSNESSIVFNFSEELSGEIIIYGWNGMKLMHHDVNGKTFQLSSLTLSQGFYLAEWRRKGEVLSRKKIILR